MEQPTEQEQKQQRRQRLIARLRGMPAYVQLRSIGVPDTVILKMAFRCATLTRRGGDSTVLKWRLACWCLLQYHPALKNEPREKWLRVRLFYRKIGRLDRDPDTRLTPAERNVAYWVLWQKSNKEIAEKRGCAASTINDHVQSIRRKMGLPPTCRNDRDATLISLLGL